MMEHLPPVGWADVATKHDLDQLERRLGMRFDTVEARFDSKLDAQLATFRAELNAQTRLMIFSLATTILAVSGVALAAAQLV